MYVIILILGTIVLSQNFNITSFFNAKTYMNGNINAKTAVILHKNLGIFTFDNNVIKFDTINHANKNKPKYINTS